MGDDPDSALGTTDEENTTIRHTRDTGDGNTRRTFLGGALGGALAGAVGIGTVGTAAAGRVTTDQFSVACDYVELTDASGIDSIRVDYRDGSYVESVNGVFLDGDETMRLGSPGRAVESVTVNDDRTFDSLDTCQPPQRRQTTFTATAVHVPPTEFVVNGWVPSSLTSAVYLHFADGTTETAQGYSADGNGTLDEFPEFDGVLTVEGVGGVTNRYRGTGDNAGKVIEAVRIETDVDYRRFHLVSDVADAALLGAETPQERPIEIVGTSQGAVEYELTATGPIRRLAINDRIGAGDNDAITENGDGTWTISGFTGNTGYGDAFVVNGEITDITQTGGDGDYVVRALERHVVEGASLVGSTGGSGGDSSSGDDSSDGDGSDDADTDGGSSDGDSSSHEVAVVATEQGEVTYEFTVDGTVERASGVAGDLVAEGNDSIRQNGDGTVTVSGFTGNTGYGDSYTVTGDLLSFERTGGGAAFRIELDGSTVSADGLVDSI